jgi:iron(III) transport system substrate-binding protein
MHMTRLHLMTGIAAAGFASGLPRLARADIAALHEAARKEATVTWYIAQVDTETAEAMGRAFTAKYPGVTVASIRTTGQVAYERLLQDLKNHAPQCDVFSGTDIAQYPELKNRDQLANYTPAGAATLLPAFRPVEDPGYWYPAASNTHLLVHHAQKVSAAEAPKNWPDLLDPKWKGRVATGHPAFSGCTGIWVLALRKKYGWEFF